MVVKSVLALDDESTWPAGLCTLLEDNLEMLRAHRRAELRHINEKDISARFRQRSNPYDAQRKRVVEECERQVSALDLVGYHCTRLHANDILAIQNEGLRPLHVDDLVRRVQRLVASGELPDGVGAQILAENQGAASNREGMIWFLFTVDGLKDESGVGSLLRWWGGEAIYQLHMNNVEVEACLRKIGTACIVEARIPSRAIQTFMSVGERFLNRYAHRRRVRTDAGPSMEGFIRESVAATKISRVIRFGDRGFRQLTHWGRWDEKPT